MSKEDVEKAIEETMEVVEDQHFSADLTAAESRAFYKGIIAACTRSIAAIEKEDDSEDVEVEIEEEEEDEET